MKFIADAMLGKLAKRLRLLGHDVLYDPGYDDNALIRLSFEQDRVILTRDTGLASRPLAENHVLIISDRADEQVRQVLDYASLPSTAILTRCSLCNDPLRTIDKHEVRNRVPEHVYSTMQNFSSCDTCGRIYWKGSHVSNMAGRKAKH